MSRGLILGIETSCDETAAAVVERGAHTLSSAVASQIATHARYGGVVPELASREHLRAIVPVVRAALAEANLTLADLDAIAVTSGPGLAGALLVGITYAKALAFANNLPLIAVNHLEGHIHAVLLNERESAERESAATAPIDCHPERVRAADESKDLLLSFANSPQTPGAPGLAFETSDSTSLNSPSAATAPIDCHPERVRAADESKDLRLSFANSPQTPGAPGLAFETSDSTSLNSPSAETAPIDCHPERVRAADESKDLRLPFANSPQTPGAPGLAFETWDSTNLNSPSAETAPIDCHPERVRAADESKDLRLPFANSPQTPGAPGLAFETWDSTNLNSPSAETAPIDCHPERVRAADESKDPRLPFANSPQTPGAPGLAFETWDSTNLNSPSALALVVSGGHTHLFLARPAHGTWTYTLIGRTVDDAAGEAFDKVAKLLGLGYPGGPWIDTLSKYGNPRAVPFSFAQIKTKVHLGGRPARTKAAKTAPIARLDPHFLFSFSGIKTAVLRYVELHGLRAEAKVRIAGVLANFRPPQTREQVLALCPQPTLDLIASFQHAVVSDLMKKTFAAAESLGVTRILVAGGVAANRELRQRFAAEATHRGLRIAFPTPALSTDNAAMVAAAAWPRFLARDFAPAGITADPSLALGSVQSR